MQKTKFTYISFKENIKDSSELLNHLTDLNEELENTNLENLLSFSKSYLIILKNIFTKLSTSYFENDELVEKLEVQSAKYFIHSLKKYVNKTDCPFVWKECFEQCEQNSSWQFVYMSMGMNANLNYDLAFALKETINTISYKEDFEKINDIYAGSIKEIISNLHEESEIMNTLENKLITVYSIFFNVISRRWRNSAWENFENLRNGYIKPKYIERYSLDILKQIIGIGYFRQFFSKSLSKLEIFQPHNHL